MVHYRITDITKILTCASNEDWGWKIRYEKYECGMEEVTIKHFMDGELKGGIEIYTRHPNGKIDLYREGPWTLADDLGQPGGYWTWPLIVHLVTTTVDTVDEWFEMWEDHFKDY